MKLWLDVDDLFFFAERSARPTGIQRLTGEVYKALHSLAGDAIGFVRHDSQGGFAIVGWAEVAETYDALVGERLPPPTAVGEAWVISLAAKASSGRTRLPPSKAA